MKLPYDNKTSWDRVGDWIFKYHIRHLKIFLLLVFIALMAYISCIEYQDYMKSFYRTVEQARTPFTKIEHVPSFHITFTN